MESYLMTLACLFFNPTTTFVFIIYMVLSFVCVFCRQLQGKGLNILKLKELQHLEQQLNNALISVRERKVN